MRFRAYTYARTKKSLPPPFMGGKKNVEELGIKTYSFCFALFVLT